MVNVLDRINSRRPVAFSSSAVCEWNGQCHDWSETRFCHFQFVTVQAEKAQRFELLPFSKSFLIAGVPYLIFDLISICRRDFIGNDDFC
uniref:Uncharacterized protein n=1 Tax=Anguilla anguilla TaxID=7936 RepID=A0A0E9W2B2_ANGAN